MKLKYYKLVFLYLFLMIFRFMFHSGELLKSCLTLVMSYFIYFFHVSMYLIWCLYIWNIFIDYIFIGAKYFLGIGYWLWSRYTMFYFLCTLVFLVQCWWSLHGLYVSIKGACGHIHALGLLQTSLLIPMIFWSFLCKWNQSRRITPGILTASHWLCQFPGWTTANPEP